VENTAYTAFCARIIRAAGRRVADGDVVALPELARLADDLDQALTDAVHGLRSFGYSWAEIAARTGISRPSSPAALGQCGMTRRAPTSAMHPDAINKRG
jgi:hypothetical protein